MLSILVNLNWIMIFIQRVRQNRISNMGALNLSDALLEMQLLQSLNTRSKSDKNYHLIVSFLPMKNHQRKF